MPIKKRVQKAIGVYLDHLDLAYMQWLQARSRDSCTGIFRAGLALLVRQHPDFEPEDFVRHVRRTTLAELKGDEAKALNNALGALLTGRGAAGGSTAEDDEFRPNLKVHSRESMVPDLPRVSSRALLQDDLT